jgi:hypothetical protein
MRRPVDAAVPRRKVLAGYKDRRPDASTALFATEKATRGWPASP